MSNMQCELNTRRFWLYLACSLCLTQLLACGGSSGASTAKQLTVASTNPAADATSVNTTTTVSAVFSATLEPGAGNTSSVALTSVVGDEAIKVASDRNNILITPIRQLSFLAKYVLRLGESLVGSAGEVFAGSSTSFTTRDGAWGDPTILRSTGRAEPQAAIDETGHYILVWPEAQAGGTSGIAAARYNSNSEELSKWVVGKSISGQNTVFPKIVMDGSGNALAAWTSVGAGETVTASIWAARYDVTANAWGEPKLVTGDVINPSSPTGVKGEVQLARNAKGNAMLLWQSNSKKAYNYALFDPFASSWSAPASVPSNTLTALPTSAWLSMNASGNAILAYVQQDGVGSPQIFTSLYSFATNIWSAKPTMLKRDGYSASVQPTIQVKLDLQGNATVIWDYFVDMSTVGLAANRYTAATGSWSEPVVLSNSLPQEQASQPSMDADNTGNVHVTWVQSTSKGSALKSRVYQAPEGKWNDKVIQYNAKDGVDDFNRIDIVQQLAVDPAGNAIVLWVDNCAMVASRYSKPANTRSDTRRVGYMNGLTCTFTRLQVVVNQRGQALTIWKQPDSEGIDYFINSNFFR